MDFLHLVLSGGPTVLAILAGMGVIAALEVGWPLHRGQSRGHLVPNLALTFVTFATNAVLNALLVLALLAIEARGSGLAHATALPGWAVTLAVVAFLDLTFYVAHVAMHHVPRLWTFHRVHHSDPQLDVTTTIRQHPGEGLIRYAFLATAAIAIGAPVEAYGVYRVLSALNGLLEHANLRVPLRLDSALARIFSTPNFHKVHHSRVPAETNTNYGNIFSLFDRAFGTFTPAERGASVVYGLDGLDAREHQTLAGLLAMPWHEVWSVFRARGTRVVDAAVAQRRGGGQAR